MLYNIEEGKRERISLTFSVEKEKMQKISNPSQNL
jgi:hypothetical protein